MDAVAEANLRLGQLGYRGEDAWVEEVGAPGTLRLTGRLLRETTADAQLMLHLLRSLPAKVELVAYRHYLRIDG